MDSKRLTDKQLRAIRVKAEAMVLKCSTIDSKPAESEVLPLLDYIDLLLADRAALEQRVGELERALKPFAKAIESMHPNATMWNVWEIRGDLVSACRAAAKALAGGDRGCS